MKTTLSLVILAGLLAACAPNHKFILEVPQREEQFESNIRFVPSYVDYLKTQFTQISGVSTTRVAQAKGVATYHISLSLRGSANDAEKIKAALADYLLEERRDAMESLQIRLAHNKDEEVEAAIRERLALSFVYPRLSEPNTN